MSDTATKTVPVKVVMGGASAHALFHDLALFVAVDDSRPMLERALIEATDDDSVLAWATNSYVMMRIVTDVVALPPGARMVIDPKAVLWAMHDHHYDIEVELSVGDDGKVLIATSNFHGRVKVLQPALDPAQYPNVHRVWDEVSALTKTSSEAFNPYYLMQFGKVLGPDGDPEARHPIRLFTSGPDGAARVDYPDVMGYSGVIMPVYTSGA